MTRLLPLLILAACAVPDARPRPRPECRALISAAVHEPSGETRVTSLECLP